MHGLIFVTWEKYLTERFGASLLSAYREGMGGNAGESTAGQPPVRRRDLLAGVGVAIELTVVAADTLLREYGRYFILTRLTGHLCTYVPEVHSGKASLVGAQGVPGR